MLAVTTLPWCVSTAAISMFPHHIVAPTNALRGPCADKNDVNHNH